MTGESPTPPPPQSPMTVGDAIRSLAAMYPTDWVEQTARETGLIKRERKVSPVAMLWVLTLSYGVELERSLAALKRAYRTKTGTTLSDSSWEDRFSPELVRFFKACVVHGIEELAKGEGNLLSERLHQFRDILIQDSTVIRLHEKLARKWPATRARKTAAGVKLATLISVVANGPKRLELTGERTSEVDTIHMGPWVKGSILLMDLGFFKYQLFARIAENGGYFVSRLKESANPVLVRSLRVHRGRAIDLAGQRWKKVEPLLHREVLDANVEMSFSRRKYAGRRSADTMEVRLVALYDAESRDYHTYVTNIPEDVLTPEEISKLYGARWEIELLFKELKGRYALDQVRTTKSDVVESLIWVAVLTLIISRRLLNLGKASLSPEMRARVNPQLWAKKFVRESRDILGWVLKLSGVVKNEEEVYGVVMGVWLSDAVDVHVERERLRDGLWS